MLTGTLIDVTPLNYLPRSVELMCAPVTSSVFGAVAWRSPRLLARCLLVSLTLGSLTACKPSPEQQASLDEQKRQHCLDNYCDDDVVPPHDRTTEIAIKRDGRWFIAPKAYGDWNGLGGFYWPSRDPLAQGAGPPIDPRTGLPQDRLTDDIELFIRRGETHDMHESVRIAEREGKIIERKRERPELETVRVWRTKESPARYLFRIATQETGMGQTHPTLFCTTDANPACTTYLGWKHGLVVYVRFDAKHGTDWPEIYQEIVRVINLIREA